MNYEGNCTSEIKTLMGKKYKLVFCEFCGDWHSQCPDPGQIALLAAEIGSKWTDRERVSRSVGPLFNDISIPQDVSIGDFFFAPSNDSL